MTSAASLYRLWRSSGDSFLFLSMPFYSHTYNLLHLRHIGIQYSRPPCTTPSYTCMAWLSNSPISRFVLVLDFFDASPLHPNALCGECARRLFFVTDNALARGLACLHHRHLPLLSPLSSCRTWRSHELVCCSILHVACTLQNTAAISNDYMQEKY